MNLFCKFPDAISPSTIIHFLTQQITTYNLKPALVASLIIFVEQFYFDNDNKEQLVYPLNTFEPGKKVNL